MTLNYTKPQKHRGTENAIVSLCLCVSIVILSFLFVSPISAQKYSNEFLSIGVGARAQALGNAVVADVGDITAGFWNPAGLLTIGQDNGLQLGAMHSEWFAGIGKFDYFGFSLPLAKTNRRVGLSLVRFGIDGIPNTLSLYESDGTINYDNITEFSAADYAVFLSYAQPINVSKGRLNVGGSLKIVHRTIGPFARSWGFGADLAAQYHINNWKLGAMFKDITTTFNAWSFSFTEDQKDVLELESNEIPINSLEITKPQLILGAARKFYWDDFSMQPELDFIISTDGKRNTLISSNPFSIDPSLGLELAYNDFIYLRGGMSQFQKEKDFDNKEKLRMRPAAGIGLIISSLKIDYAFSDIGSSDNTYSHVFSLILNLKPKTSNQ